MIIRIMKLSCSKQSSNHRPFVLDGFMVQSCRACRRKALIHMVTKLKKQSKNSFFLD